MKFHPSTYTYLALLLIAHAALMLLFNLSYELIALAITLHLGVLALLSGRLDA